MKKIWPRLTESVAAQIGPLLEEFKIMRAREGESLEAILRASLDRLAEATEEWPSCGPRSSSATRSGSPSA